VVVKGFNLTKAKRVATPLETVCVRRRLATINRKPRPSQFHRWKSPPWCGGSLCRSKCATSQIPGAWVQDRVLAHTRIGGMYPEHLPLAHKFP
jgi:hypothetical protein